MSTLKHTIKIHMGKEYMFCEYKVLHVFDIFKENASNKNEYKTFDNSVRTFSEFMCESFLKP